MADNLGVSPAKLQETVNTLNELKATMASKLGNISSSVSDLRSSWDSPASQNLQAIAGNMSSRFAELEKEVTGFATFLEGVISRYGTTEAAAQESTDAILSAFR